MRILVVADHDNETVKAPTLVSVAAAAAIGGDVEVLVAGAGCGAAAEAAAKINGVSKVLVADNAAYGHALAENLAALVADIGSNYSHILTGTTTTGKNFMPRVAALLDVAQISDISGVVSEVKLQSCWFIGFFMQIGALVDDKLGHRGLVELRQSTVRCLGLVLGCQLPSVLLNGVNPLQECLWWLQLHDVQGSNESLSEPFLEIGRAHV